MHWPRDEASRERATPADRHQLRWESALLSEQGTGASSVRLIAFVSRVSLSLSVDCFPFHLFIGLTSLFCCAACGSDSPVKIIDNNVNKFLRKFTLRFSGRLVEPTAAVGPALRLACRWSMFAINCSNRKERLKVDCNLSAQTTLKIN